jgi:hypothetical protein
MPELRAFVHNIWIADSPNVRDFGIMFTNRMIVFRLGDGWDFDKLIIAHCACIESNAKSFVARAFRWIMA